MNRLNHKIKTLSLVTLISLGFLSSVASAKEFISQNNATEVIELFTSEGCSSCPPADRWLSTLKNKSETFKSIIPMSFHVDYWDYIGWKDRFAKNEYTQRQRQYVATSGVSQAYTPQMVTNSNEWRGFISGQRKWVPNERDVGVLKVTLPDNAKEMVVRFAPNEKRDNYVINVAILGMGLISKVTSGENHDRTLKHDFVVLKHQEQAVAGNPSAWKVALPAIPNAGQAQSAVAVWLSEPGTQRIIQATGGYL